MPPLNDPITHELQALHEYVNAIRGVLASGRMPEMIGLEKRIAELCQSINLADPDAQKHYLPELKKLLEYINICEDDLRTFNSSYLNSSNQND